MTRIALMTAAALILTACMPAGPPVRGEEDRGKTSRVYAPPLPPVAAPAPRKPGFYHDIVVGPDGKVRIKITVVKHDPPLGPPLPEKGAP